MGFSLYRFRYKKRNWKRWKDPNDEVQSYSPPETNCERKGKWRELPNYVSLTGSFTPVLTNEFQYMMYVDILFKVHALVLLSKTRLRFAGFVVEKDAIDATIFLVLNLRCWMPPIGVWHCHFCVRKKIEFGCIFSVRGVESVWDVKEVSFANVDGFTSQKEFLVKYKDLAHVHNRWVPENQLLLEAPLALMKFNQKNQTLRLKPEWSLPHRLLQKRALICGQQHDDNRNNNAADNFDCCYEWLVKWRDLGYEHATWEMDNASFLCSPEGQSLIRCYEGRFQRAKRISSCSELDKKPDRGKSIIKLSQMPGGVSAGFGNNNLDAVNKLREHWHKGQNAIVVDDHERILKVVAFILSLHSDTYRPFLIITTAASLLLWEKEFCQLDPSIDVVIYNGNKEIRNIVRRLEFYDEGHHILFQVLIVVPEILIEDMDVLGGIEWEAITVDEGQSPKISSYFKQIRMLNTHLRIFFSVDSIVENINFLALLDDQSDNEKDGLISNSNNSVVQLKERLTGHIAYRCKSDSFRFVEYWVPVQISHVQLEQYCATLLSNASILCSSSKIDSGWGIRDILIAIRKSIGGSGRDSIGDILDDFLRQRFGLDSYERIDKRSRKKVHHFDGSVDGSHLVSEGTAKKRRKVSNNIVNQPLLNLRVKSYPLESRQEHLETIQLRVMMLNLRKNAECMRYEKRNAELTCQHEKRLKDLEDVQSAQMLKFRDREAIWVEDVESWAQNELLNIVTSKELRTEVDYLQICDQVQPRHGPKNHFAQGKGHDDRVEAIAKTGTGVPVNNSPAVAPCSSTVELQNPLVKHTGANEMGIMVSKDQFVSASEGRNIAENQYDSQGNIISEHSHSREQNSDGAPSMTDEGNGCENFTHGSRDGGNDTVKLVLPSSNGETCVGDKVHSSTQRKLIRSMSSKSRDGTKHTASLNSQSPEKHVPSVNAMSLPECENAAQIHVADDYNGSYNSVPVSSPLSDERIGDGAIVNVLDREAPLGMPGTASQVMVPVETPVMVNFTSCLKNAAHLNPPSSADQISDRDSLDVPVLDSDLASRPCQAASSSSGPVTISLSNLPLEQQILDGYIPVTLPENRHAVADCHNDIEPLMNTVLVDKSITSDQEEGVPRTMRECILSQETSVSRSVNVMEPLEQGQQLSSVESPPNQDTAGEMQNSSEHVELVHQLPSAEFPSNLDSSNFPLATQVEHPPINEDDLPSHYPEASNVVPNQDVVQPDSNSELDSHSHQDGLHPASNSDPYSLAPGGVRTQSSNPRNLSTPSEINNHPMQTATNSASRMLPHLCYDPLKNELERIQKVTEQTMKNYEDMKLRLKSDFDKEFEELRRKYDIKFQEIEVEFQQSKKTLDTSLKIVRVNKILADAFRSKCLDLKVSGTPGMHQDSSLAEQLFQLSRQQSATRPSLVAGPSSCGPSATSLQSPSTSASSQHMVPSIQAGYSMPGIFSPGLPPINSVPSPSGNDHTGGEIRAPAPHLQPYRPPTSVPASSLPSLPLGMPSQPAPSNIPAASPSFSHGPPRPIPTAYQSDRHMGHRPDSACGLATPNLPAMDLRVNARGQSSTNLPNVLPRVSDVPSVNLSRFGTSGSVLANSSHQAPSQDLVCLSDDD
ncbi:SNF2-like, N-terminal domain superfamily [Sesbania bispinosa]|nr:SNF2-like, N-terminal domain superfamily [Sesbania bispinosa]